MAALRNLAHQRRAASRTLRRGMGWMLTQSVLARLPADAEEIAAGVGLIAPDSRG